MFDLKKLDALLKETGGAWNTDKVILLREIVAEIRDQMAAANKSDETMRQALRGLSSCNVALTAALTELAATQHVINTLLQQKLIVTDGEFQQQLELMQQSAESRQIKCTNCGAEGLEIDSQPYENFMVWSCKRCGHKGTETKQG